eukprot:jgi/Psemu1/228269/e_gw1.2301.1.1
MLPERPGKRQPLGAAPPLTLIARGAIPRAPQPITTIPLGPSILGAFPLIQRRAPSTWPATRRRPPSPFLTRGRGGGGSTFPSHLRFSPEATTIPSPPRSLPARPFHSPSPHLQGLRPHSSPSPLQGRCPFPLLLHERQHGRQLSPPFPLPHDLGSKPHTRVVPQPLSAPTPAPAPPPCSTLASPPPSAVLGPPPPSNLLGPPPPLTFTTQKNGDKGEVVAHARSGDSLCYPVAACARQVLHLRCCCPHSSSPFSPSLKLASYFDNGVLTLVRAATVTSSTRVYAQTLYHTTGISPPAAISARSL